MMIPRLLSLAAVGVLAIAAGTANPEGMDIVTRYEADHRGVTGFFDIPWSEASTKRRTAHLTAWEQELQAADFTALPLDDKIDWLLLRNHIQNERAELALESQRLAEIAPLLPFREDIVSMESRRSRMEKVDPEAAAAMLAKWPEAIKQVRERIEAGKKDPKDKDKDKENHETASVIPLKVSPVLARRAAEAITALLVPLKRWSEFYTGYRPDFAWWIKTPLATAEQSVEDYRKFLMEEMAGLKNKDDDPLLGDPIGRDALVWSMAAEVLAGTPEDLIAIGEREFAWCTREMEIQAKAMDCVDLPAALEKLKLAHVPPGEQDSLVTSQGREAIRFVKDRDLVTIPPLCEETWRLTMISPEQQKTLPFAAYGGQVMMVAYPRDDMPHADKLMSLRGNNRHFSRIVTPHELIPGHHLQKYMAQRHKPWRGIFSTPFYVEGWALHWEMKLWDLGWAGTPEEKLGMLFWRRHRCARIIVSVKFHLGTMQPTAMVDFLTHDTGLEKSGAMGEVRRFIGGAYSPLYQCGYMIGGLQLRALAAEAKGAGMADKSFHDFVLHQGPIPIEYLRCLQRGEAPAKDAPAQWLLLPSPEK